MRDTKHDIQQPGQSGLYAIRQGHSQRNSLYLFPWRHLFNRVHESSIPPSIGCHDKAWSHWKRPLCCRIIGSDHQQNAQYDEKSVLKYPPRTSPNEKKLVPTDLTGARCQIRLLSTTRWISIFREAATRSTLLRFMRATTGWRGSRNHRWISPPALSVFRVSILQS